MVNSNASQRARRVNHRSGDARCRKKNAGHKPGVLHFVIKFWLNDIVAVRPARDQLFNRAADRLGNRLIDRSERRLREAHDWGVVEGDERKIARHIEPTFARDLERRVEGRTNSIARRFDKVCGAIGTISQPPMAGCSSGPPADSA